MEIGVTFPQHEIGPDPIAIRDFAQAIEGLGFSHFMSGDHVLGEDPRKFRGRPGPYTVDFIYHEPFCLFSYLASVTTQIGFISGIVILPQRQTVLVAKQAAEIDFLSQGRLRLGVGVGWNKLEYDALNESFPNRGARTEEQFDVMRTLWTQPIVTYDGRWHRIDGAGLNPLPVQRPIPIWIGGNADAVIERAARLADGWIVAWNADVAFTPANAADYIKKLRRHVVEAGREPSAVGVQGSMSLTEGSPADWRRTRDEWRALGVDALMVGTRYMPGSPADHVATYKRFRDEVGLD